MISWTESVQGTQHTLLRPAAFVGAHLPRTASSYSDDTLPFDAMQIYGATNSLAAYILKLTIQNLTQQVL